MRITLAGMEYHCYSPSLFELVVSEGHEPKAPWLGCGGPSAWRVGTAATWGARLFASRQEAAQWIADAFALAAEKEMGA